jgi:hypothetical protein
MGFQLARNERLFVSTCSEALGVLWRPFMGVSYFCSVRHNRKNIYAVIDSLQSGLFSEMLVLINHLKRE